MRSNRFQGCPGDCLRDRRQDDGQPHPFLMVVQVSALPLPGANRPSDICVSTLTLAILKIHGIIESKNLSIKIRVKQ